MYSQYYLYQEVNINHSQTNQSANSTNQIAVKANLEEPEIP